MRPGGGSSRFCQLSWPGAAGESRSPHGAEQHPVETGHRSPRGGTCQTGTAIGKPSMSGVGSRPLAPSAASWPTCRCTTTQSAALTGPSAWTRPSCGRTSTLLEPANRGKRTERTRHPSGHGAGGVAGIRPAVDGRGLPLTVVFTPGDVDDRRCFPAGSAGDHGVVERSGAPVRLAER